MTNTSEAPDPYEQLFRARWNVPRAAKEMGLPACEDSWEKVKVLFREWCKLNPVDYVH